MPLRPASKKQAATRRLLLRFFRLLCFRVLRSIILLRLRVRDRPGLLCGGSRLLLGPLLREGGVVRAQDAAGHLFNGQSDRLLRQGDTVLLRLIGDFPRSGGHNIHQQIAAGNVLEKILHSRVQQHSLSILSKSHSPEGAQGAPIMLSTRWTRFFTRQRSASRMEPISRAAFITVSLTTR